MRSVTIIQLGHCLNEIDLESSLSRNEFVSSFQRIASEKFNDPYLDFGHFDLVDGICFLAIDAISRFGSEPERSFRLLNEARSELQSLLGSYK